MGKLIRKKIKGLSWKVKISLILSFTVLFSVFMYEGWYKPRQTQAATVTFSASGSWQAPTTETITVECWGGGGGGGAGNNTNNIGGGGGGGGEYRKGSVSVTAGNTYNFTVGAGGTGTNVNGGAGAQTTFNSTSVVAKGGSGGLAAAGGGGTGGTGGTGALANFNGGNGAAGNGLNSGGGGGAAGTTGIGGNASGTAAGNAGSGDGTAGAGGTGVSLNGSAGGTGNVYGGGGAGSTGKTVLGANGAGGYIRITYTPVADTTPPQVSSVAVQTGLKVNITFNEAMGTGVTTASNYTVSGTGKGSLANNPNSVALVSGNTYELTWSAGEMINGGNITITVANAQDAAGNTIGTPNNATHTGGAIGVLPTVSSTTPANGATGVSPNTSLVVVFSENVDCVTAASGNITMAGATIGSAVCSAPTNTITYPVSGQSGSTLYNYTIGGVKDVAGNTMATTASRSYTTSAVDSTPPTVSSTTPANGATGIAVNASLVVVFSENIDCATAAAGNISMGGATIGAPTCSAPTTTITYPISGQTGGTLYTYTVGGVKDVAGNTMTTTANRTYTTEVPAGNPNTVSVTGNTPLAAAATDTTQNVLMQRITVDSNTAAGSDNQLILTSLTIDDNAATATLYKTVKVYIGTTSSTTLPTYAVLLGGKSDWNGASTVLALTGGSTSDRTVTAGTSKYIYIVYDMADGQNTRTVLSRVTNVGVSAPDTGAAVSLSSNSFTLTDGTTAALVTSCGSCHTYPVTDASGTARNTPATAVVGSHAKHGSTCSNCHVAPATQTSADFAHRNGTIEFIAGVGYSRGNIAQTNPTDGTGLGTCSTASCHDAYGTTGVLTPKWGVAATCASCHAASPATGNHALHMGLGGAACNQCHDGALAGSSGGTAHLDYDIDVTGGYPANVARHSAGSGYSSCNSVAACHPNVYGTGSATTPLWGSTGNGCSACHSTAIATTGPATGSHANHAITDCSNCHTGATNSTTKPTANHIDGDIDVNSGYTANVAKHTTVSGYESRTCTTTTCHGSNSPVWGANTTNASCTKCHGVSGTTPAQYTADNKTAAPGYSGGRDTGGATAATDAEVGAHAVHLAAAPNYSDPMACNVCHKDVNPTNATFTGHMNGAGTVVFFGLATTNHPVNPTYNGTSCTNTYCHFGKSIGGYAPAVTNAAVTWTDTGYLAFGTPTLAGDCSKCHLSPPATTGNHTTGMVIGDCNGCHSHVNTNGTFNNKSLHINGKVEGAGSCVDCHAVAKGTRSAVVGEFGLAWGHKKSGRGTVTDDDCIVCHLEGDSSTKKINSAYHLGQPNGNIDLRDPDGTGEAAITGLTFTKFAISYASGSRTSSIGTTVDFKITTLFCLKCHDSDGATNTSARSGTSPNATNPFGTGKLAINNAAEFATTNSSKHPVLGPLTKDYPTAAKLADPYKPTGTRGTSGTKTAGVVMNCFDCHTTGTALVNRTIVAHGNANTIRGTIGTAESSTSSFCNSCHLNYSATNQESHGAGSAFNPAAGTHGNMDTWIMACNACHASSIAPTRPEQAVSTHGVNTLPAGTKTGRWLAGGTQGVPVSFIRNTGYLSNHQPLKIGTTTYSPQCDMVNCGGRSGSPYLPGGTY